MPVLFKPNNPVLVSPSPSISVSAIDVILSMSWCPSGVQYSAALSPDFNYRRYGIVTCPGAKWGTIKYGIWAFGLELASVWLECIWQPALSVSTVFSCLCYGCH